MHTPRHAFTLVELLIVISVMALMAAMLIPSMSAALEQGRIASCASVLHHVAVAVEQYTVENNNHFPFSYDFRVSIAPYLGLGNCVVLNNPWNLAIPWDQVKQFQCPSGAKLGKTASADGKMAVQSYWQINSYFLGGAGPIQGFYPNLQAPQGYLGNWPGYFCGGGPSRCGLLVEEWQVNTISTNRDPADQNSPTYQVSASYCAQPYTTHYKFGNNGVQGIGRNLLFADWHIVFRRTTLSGPFDGVADAGYWSDASAQAHWITSQKLDRGNEVGYSFLLGGKTFWGWRPILRWSDLNTFEIAYWYGQ